MASSVASPPGTFRQVGKEKTFSWDEDSGLHVTNRVREFDFTPLQSGVPEPSSSQGISNAVPKKKGKAAVGGAKDSSEVVKSGGRMRLGHPVAAAGGVLALAVWKTVSERRKRGHKKEAIKDVLSGEAKGSTPCSPLLPTPSATIGESFTATVEVKEANVTGTGDVHSTMDTAATPVPVSSRVEEGEEWPEPGTPRSARTVSSAGGGSLYSLAESQSQRLASHRKEVVMKLRQQLQSRDEMILDMQRQLEDTQRQVADTQGQLADAHRQVAAQEHFTKESRNIVQELEQQLKQAMEAGQKLGLENRDLADEVQRLTKAVGESARLAQEKEELRKRVEELKRGGKEQVVKVERGRKDLDEERDRLRGKVEEQQKAIDGFEWEKARLQGKLREKEEALSEARAQLSSKESTQLAEETGPRMQALLKERERLVGELEKTKVELGRVKAESEARAEKERRAADKVGLVEKDLDRCQKMLKGKDRLLEGYEKERVHLTAVLQDLEHKVEVSKHELEVYQQSTAAATTEDVQSSNDSDGHRTMAGASPTRGEEIQSKARNPGSLQLMKSFDNPLSDMSPDTSPNGAGRPMSVSKPGRPYDSRMFDESVYPSPNGVLDNLQRRRSVDDQHSTLKPAQNPDVARLSYDVDALARELSERFRTVTEKKRETGRLVADLQRHNDLIVDLQRKIGKDTEFGEERWSANGGKKKEESWAKQADGAAQAAILAKKLEQVALQRQMDERLAEIEQQESEISRLKNRVASLVGKANGAQKVDPSEVFHSHSDVLGDELAHKLASQERQATEALTEVHRLSATFQKGSPLFAKAQDELVRRSLSSLDGKSGRINGFGAPAGQRSAGEAHQRRLSGTDALMRASTGLERASSHSNGNHAMLVGNGSEPDSENELARLTVEVERELSQDFGKRLDASGNALHEMNGGDSPDDGGSQGSGEMELDEEESGGEAEGDRKSENMDSILAEMLESTLDDMVRMCTPATSQANSPFPSKRF